MLKPIAIIKEQDSSGKNVIISVLQLFTDTSVGTFKGEAQS